jgi:4-amino-4-deoxy-L-arabinose transferase-like glycosyltransferase
VVLFIAMSAWWLTQDDRLPDWDSGTHEMLAASVHAELTSGQLLRPLTDFILAYPPLVHLVGGIAIFLTGVHPMALILSSNVVFVPLLAFGCFGVGRIAYGRRAGLLAAILALGSPMFISMMHEYDLDPPQAAMVAVSVWAVLASKRFERVGIAALAGALSGLALLVKETSIVFLAGFLAVAVVRAGPRRYRGLIAYFATLAVLAGPWYVYHWHALINSYNTIGGEGQGPPRFSAGNVAWYGWDLVNQQVLAPFALAFLIGAVLAGWRIVRGRVTTESFEPELLAGVAVSYLGMTYVMHKDPRYTLPMLVYVAVLATGWIGVISRPRLRAALCGAVVVLAIVYFVGLSAGIGGAVRIALPGMRTDNAIHTRQLTLYETDGWVRGGPIHDANVQGLLASLRRMGIRGVIVDAGAHFNTSGLRALALTEGVAYGGAGYPLVLPPNQEAQLILRPRGAPGPRPCQRFNDGAGIYLVRGPAPGLEPTSLRDPTDPRQRYTLVCPGRAASVYP